VSASNCEFGLRCAEPRYRGATPADAAHAIQWDKRLSSNPEAEVTTRDITIPPKEGGLAARGYIPGGKGPFPVVVYYHGGGWVVADINV
jgi:acetyl esterase/lipase